MRLGIDIGGTKTDAAAIDDDGILLHVARTPTGRGASAVVDAAVATVRQIEREAGIGAADFHRIGVGVPGVVDRTTGRVSHAVNLGCDDIDLAQALSERLGAPVRIENDVNAAAIGAYRLLGLASSMAYLNLGTGLAAGIVIDGELWRGSRGLSGEIGHIPVDPRGVLCACGQRGCLETIASGSAVARQWLSEDPHPARALVKAAQHDPRAREVMLHLLDGIATAVQILVAGVGVETVVIAGGLSNLGDPLRDGIRQALRERAECSPFLASLELPDRIQMLPPGLPVAVFGAAIVDEVGCPGENPFQKAEAALVK